MIAFLINELNIRGGTHKQLLKLLEFAAAQSDDFIIITKELDFEKTYPGFKQFENKIRLFRPRTPSKSIFGKIINRRKDIKKLQSLIEDVDCVNIHDCGFETLSPAFKGKKAIWQINDMPNCYAVGNSKQTNKSLKQRLIGSLIKYYTKYYDIFTVNVSKNKDRIRSIFNREAKVLYCGIEPVKVERKRKDTISRFNAHKINLLSSGVFFPYRNYETQIEVVELLLSKGYDVHLNIIGSTTLNKAYSEKISKLICAKGLESHIHICGQVDEDEFKKLHSESDIFIFINVDQSWGLAVFEAMSCGIPVIVSNSVGATEILADRENSIFVDPMNAGQIANEIISLASSEQTYDKISTNSADFHKRYTWDHAYCAPMYSLLTEK